MSRYIDPSDMSKDDVEYVKQRPTLLREFQMQELGDPTAKGYKGHNFDWDEEYGDGESSETSALEQAQQEADEAQREEQQRLEREEAERVAAEAAAAETEEGETDDESEELPAEKQWNSDMKKAELEGVVAARNADYDEDEQIVLASGYKVADLISALEQDDRELAGE